MLGRLMQPDCGTRIHAVVIRNVRGRPFISGEISLCGSRPSKNSIGWSDFELGDVNCPRCLKIIERKQQNEKQRA
jgi:uncharacterized protein (UPF0212 family)